MVIYILFTAICADFYICKKVLLVNSNFDCPVHWREKRKENALCVADRGQYTRCDHQKCSVYKSGVVVFSSKPI